AATPLMVLTLFSRLSPLAPSAPPGDPAPNAATAVTNSIGMKLVKIPSGEFEMGLRASVPELAKTFPKFLELTPVSKVPRLERLTGMTPHKVRITRPFFMGTCEVTIGQFKRFVEDAHYLTEPERDGTGGYGVDLATKVWSTAREKRYSWRNVG